MLLSEVAEWREAERCAGVRWIGCSVERGAARAVTTALFCLRAHRETLLPERCEVCAACVLPLVVLNVWCRRRDHATDAALFVNPHSCGAFAAAALAAFVRRGGLVDRVWSCALWGGGEGRTYGGKAGWRLRRATWQRRRRSAVDGCCDGWLSRAVRQRRPGAILNGRVWGGSNLVSTRRYTTSDARRVVGRYPLCLLVDLSTGPLPSPAHNRGSRRHHAHHAFGTSHPPRVAGHGGGCGGLDQTDVEGGTVLSLDVIVAARPLGASVGRGIGELAAVACCPLWWQPLRCLGWMHAIAFGV